MPNSLPNCMLLVSSAHLPLVSPRTTSLFPFLAHQQNDCSCFSLASVGTGGIVRHCINPTGIVCLFSSATSNLFDNPTSYLLPTTHYPPPPTITLVVLSCQRVYPGWLPFSTRWPRSASGKGKEKSTLSQCRYMKKRTLAGKGCLLSPLPATTESHQRLYRTFKAFLADPER